VSLSVGREFIEKRKNLRLSGTLKFGDERMSGWHGTKKVVL
jgi:hypothetical protein